MKTRKIALDKLTPDPRNPRRHDARNIAAIKASLEAFTQYRPLVVQQSTMQIIVGNGTHAAMLELGWTHADCLVVDISDTEARKLAIADNRTSELATWDETVLGELLQGLLVDGEDASVTGFDEAEIDHLLAGLGDSSGDDDDENDDLGTGDGDPNTGNRVACQIGQYRWRMPVDVFDLWLESLQLEVGFDDSSVRTALQQRLGLDPEQMESQR